MAFTRIQVRARMNTRSAKSTGSTIGAFLEALLLFFIAVAGQASIAAAQSGGTFTATGSMTSARAGHTATLLLNGKVLIAGGPGSSAELYDPISGTFTPTGNMTAARRGHTATLLPDGRVLIVGGYGDGPGGPLASAELYDASTGTFIATGAMTIPRGFHTATLLAGGSVLITGGIQEGASAELYDSSRGTFRPTGSMTDGFFGPTATLLGDGTVLIAGLGNSSPGPGLLSGQLYDPSTDSFSPRGKRNDPTNLAASYYGHAATLLTNGNVLISGGGEFDTIGQFFTQSELYDSANGTFDSAGSMTMGRVYHAATLLPGGSVLITGGLAALGPPTASAELYDPVTGSFSSVGNMTTGRLWHTATLLRDGTVLIAGGSSTTPISGAELYHPAGIQFTPKVQIVDNNTGSLTTLAVGDSFSFLVTGAPPVSLVSVSEVGWSGSVGYTDASGLFWLNGIVGPNVVGTWQQTWTIGGVLAQPSPLQFTITPKP
jgi:hypothetical protein